MSNSKHKTQNQQGQQNQSKLSRKWTDYAYEYAVDPVQAKSFGLTQVQIEEARRTGGAYQQTHGLCGRIDLIRFDQLNTPSWVQTEVEWDLIRPNVGQTNRLGGPNQWWVAQIKKNKQEFEKWEKTLEAEGMPAELPSESEKTAQLGFKTSRILVQLRANIDRINTDKLGRASRKLILNLAQVEVDWLESAEMPDLARGLGYTSSRGLQKAVEIFLRECQKFDILCQNAI